MDRFGGLGGPLDDVYGALMGVLTDRGPFRGPDGGLEVIRRVP